MHLCIPLLLDVLPGNYWTLLCLYVFAIRLLYEPSDVESRSLAQQLITIYHSQLGEYFGMQAYSYTIHAHLHLVEQVVLHGPLHSHSQFVFEVCFYYTVT